MVILNTIVTAVELPTVSKWYVQGCRKQFESGEARLSRGQLHYMHASHSTVTITV